MQPLIRKQKSDPSRRPFLIIWETTRACDLARRHCRAEARPEADPRALSTVEARLLPDQARRFGKPAPIFISSQVFQGLRDPARLKGRCGRCEFAAACGGSRSRAYAATGDPFAEEPLCDYEPRSFPFQDEIAELLRR